MTRTARGEAPAAHPLDALAARIADRSASVCVVGLGYVGLPVLVALHRAGFRVAGLDHDRAKVEALRAGRSPIIDVADADLARIEAEAFAADPAVLDDADVVVLCLPTPLAADGVPDLGMVEAAAGVVAAHLRPGTLVVLESTTYPGTTEELLVPILEKSGLTAGQDIAVAYSPERIDPGRSRRQLGDTPKIVSGLTDRCRDLAVSLYGSVAGSVATTSRPREAEMAKLIENTYRQVNIALVNELAIVARDLDVDIWEALEAAATKPFGYQVFWPGPGVGGHCIAIDPTYLSWRASQHEGYRPGFIEHANDVNERMPAYVAERVIDLLDRAGIAIEEARILGIGVAFKPGVGDLRGSPSVEVLARLADAGARIAYHDALVPAATIGGRELRSTPIDAAEVDRADVVVLLTPHPSLDLDGLLRRARRVFDARGVTAGRGLPGVERL